MRFERRSVLGGMVGLSTALPFLSMGSPALAAQRVIPHKSGMKHRNWSGQLSVYLAIDPDRKELGREIYDFTIQPDGFRTIRQISEWDDVDFLKTEPTCDLGDQVKSQTMKDVILNVTDDFTAVSAFVQFFSQQKMDGSAWFNFTDTGVECIGSSPARGSFREEYAYANVRPHFYFHSIIADVPWYLKALIDKARGKPVPKSDKPRLRFMSTASVMGNTGPELVPPLDGPEGGRPFFKGAYLGRESITVAAGTFDAFRCRVTQSQSGQVLDYWLIGDDYIPARCIAHGLHWDLVQLSGDYI